MRTKRVNRYYCDFCPKAGGSAGHMKRHERGCTMNPDRVCGVCGIVEATQRPIQELIALLPNHLNFQCYGEGHEGYDAALTITANKKLPRLREAANDCPACILAAIRQAHIPVPMVSDFNWTREMQAVWDAINRLTRHGE